MYVYYKGFLLGKFLYFDFIFYFMKILLLNPSQAYYDGETPFVVFPLGLGYLASVLKNEGFNLNILDCIGQGNNLKSSYIPGMYLFGLSFPSILSRIKLISPDVILLPSSFSSQHHVVEKIIKIIRSVNKDIKIILGGNHAASSAEEILMEGFVDFVILGEGEISIVKLLKFLSSKNNKFDIGGVGYKSKGEVIINNEVELVHNLDDIPFPARELFPFKKYVNSSNKHTLFDSGRRIAEIITSRGCPYSCSYCASKIISGKRWRRRSINNIVDEILLLKKEYFIEEIHFVDDNLNLDKTHFKNLCKTLIKLNINIKWTVPNGINISGLDKNLLKLMKDSGCYALFLPVENINPKIVKVHINKNHDLSHIKKIIAHAKKLDFYLVGFFLIGFYEETFNSVIKNIWFASSLGIDEAQFSIVSPLPGTKYYEDTLRFNIKKKVFSPKSPSFNTKYLSKKKLIFLKNYAYFQFEIFKFFRGPVHYFNKSQVLKLKRYLKYFFGV